MELEEIVEKILSSRPNLKPQEVLKRINNKKKRVGNFLTDNTAARLVASELGVEILQKPLKLEVLIQNLVSGLSNVTITGRVIAVTRLKTFIRRDQTNGKLIRLLIADKSGILKVALWDDMADLIEVRKIKSGQVIKISHGYVSEGWDGKLELHVRSRGDVQTPSQGKNLERTYPPISKWVKKIGEITEENGPITVEGTITTIPTLREVTTSRKEKVKVTFFDLRDDTGKIRVSVWREEAEIMKEVAIETRIKITNAYVKKGLVNQLELTSRSFTNIEIEPERNCAK